MATTITSTVGSVVVGGIPTRANQATNPNLVASTTNWANWAGTGGACTVTRAPTNGPSGVGYYRAQWTTGAAIGTGGLLYNNTAVIPNRVYTFSMWVRTPLQTQIVVPQIQFYNGATPTASTAGAQFTLAPDTWTRVNMNATSGPNDTKVDFRVYATAPGSTAFTAGKMMDGADVLIEWRDGLGSYFDGSTPPNGELFYVWTGAPNASTSYEQLPIYAGIKSTTPRVVNGFTSTRASRNRVHEVLGLTYPLITAGTPNYRTGTFELLYEDENTVVEAEEMHMQGGKFLISDPDRPSITMAYVLGGNLTRELDDETRELWVLKVDYQEVPEY